MAAGSVGIRTTVNIRGLFSYMIETEIFMDEVNPDIACFTEHCLQQSHLATTPASYFQKFYQLPFMSVCPVFPVQIL